MKTRQVINRRRPLIQNVTRDVITDVVTSVINPHGVPGDAILTKGGIPILTIDGKFILTK